MNRVRILLVDDHPLIRKAVRDLIAEVPDFEIVGEAADGKEGLVLAAELHPDIVVLDIAMPQLNGEQAARELRRRHPLIKIVALSGYADRQFVRAMSKAGVKGYVIKSASGRELISALRAVAQGKNYLSPEVTGAVMSVWDEPAPSHGAAAGAALGKREKEVLTLIAEGQRSAAIARKMGITVATVEAHRRNVMRKLQLHSAADLTRYAIREGFISV
jgi:DNA-binding NarL/FixJ family response regulator